MYFERFRPLIAGLVVLLAGFTVASCSSTGSKNLEKALPSWVTHTPSDEGDSYVFVGSGTSESGDIGTAEKAAAADLRDQIVSYLGVQVTSTSTATAKGSLDSYQAQVEQTVVSKSKAEVAGLRIADRFPLQRGKSLTIYLKALYNKVDLDREKARLQALFAEIDDAVSIPEKKGDNLAASGDIFGAIDQYTLAAAAALNPNVDNARIRLERNLGKAQTLLSRLTILPLIGRQTTEVGQAFPKPFAVKVVLGSTLTDPPVSGVSLRFNYKKKVNGRLVFASEMIKTDNKGVASFAYPVPDFATTDNVIVVFDIGPFLDRLSGVPRSSRDRVEALEDTVGKSRVNLPFTVVSGARKIPLSLLLLELDSQGAVLSHFDAQSSLTSVLTKADFRITTLRSTDEASLANASDDRVLSTLRKIAEREGAKRLGFGTASITQLTEDGGMFTAQVNGQFKVWDLHTGNLLYSESKTRIAVGSDKVSATANAMRQLGEEFGKSLVDNLP
jgi:hypothetical protein